MATRALITHSMNPRAGQPVEIRTLIQHPMETGLRLDADGRAIPRNLVRRFTCHRGEHLLFSADLHAAVAANPYLAFWLRLPESATLTLRWVGDQGFAHTETVRIELT
jgi:sulfur-oxidizing protein SoxZ